LRLTYIAEIIEELGMTSSNSLGTSMAAKVVADTKFEEPLNKIDTSPVSFSH